jgi:hypothetical protein
MKFVIWVYIAAMASGGGGAGGSPPPSDGHMGTSSGVMWCDNGTVSASGSECQYFHNWVNTGREFSNLDDCAKVAALEPGKALCASSTWNPPQ